MASTLTVRDLEHVKENVEKIVSRLEELTSDYEYEGELPDEYLEQLNDIAAAIMDAEDRLDGLANKHEVELDWGDE